jgi:hypothetical protein
MPKHSPVDTLKLHKDEPAAVPKVITLADYNHHRIALWGTMAELCAWNADSLEGSPEQRSLLLMLQVRGVTGCLEMA